VADFGDIGPRDNYRSVSYGPGSPNVVDMTAAVPFNDAPMMEARIERLIEEGRKPACLIMEAAMMNWGGAPGARLPEAVREITRKHGIVLISTR
jgi:glutamate-1-semialdehyde 2,1-aminomutase